MYEDSITSVKSGKCTRCGNGGYICENGLCIRCDTAVYGVKK